MASVSWGSGVAWAAASVLLSAMAGSMLVTVEWQSLGGTASLLLLSAVAAAVVLIFMVARRVRGVVGALLMVQGAYFVLAYLARPLVLILVNPRPRFNDPIADTRLFRVGYSEGLAPVLLAVIAGTTTYVIVVWLSTRRLRTTSTEVVTLPTNLLLLLFGVGWVARFASTLALNSSVLVTLAALGSVAVGLIVLYAERLGGLLVGILVASELAWSVLLEVKAPVMALVLWLLIRVLARGGRMNWRVWVPVGAIGLVGFMTIQELRVRSGRLAAVGDWEEGYPGWLRPFLPLLARFDLLFTATDAVRAGAGAWISVDEWFGRLIAGLLPQQLVGAKELAGEVWGTEVRRLSLPGEAGANLAEGPVGDGFVLAGHLGVVVETACVAVITLWVARAIQSRRLPVAIFGVAMTSQPFLFERGLLGIFEGAGKSLQIALIGFAALAVLTSLFGRQLGHVDRATLKPVPEPRSERFLAAATTPRRSGPREPES